MIIKYGQNEKKLDLSLVMVVITCVSILLQLYALPRQLDSLVSITARLLLILWLLFTGISILSRLSRPIPYSALSFLGILGLSVIVYILSGAATLTLSSENLVSMVGFLILPLMLLYSYLFSFSDRVKQVILVFYFLLSLVLIQLYFSDFRHLFRNEYGITNIDVVTLGFSNSNQTAMFLLVCFLGLVTDVFFVKSLLLKLILSADAVFIAYLTILTDSRTTSLLLAVFLIFLFYAIFRKFSGKWVIAVLLVPLVYALLPLLFTSITEITFMDELFYNGREEIFARYYNRFGLYTALVGDMRTFNFENLHNGYVAIAASLGLPVCVAYCISLRRSLTHNIPTQNTVLYQRVAFAAALCLILHTSAEAAFFVGGATYAFLLFSFCILFAKPYDHQETLLQDVSK